MNLDAVFTRADRFMTRHFTRPSITWRAAVTIVVPLIAENLFSTLFGLLNTGMISRENYAKIMYKNAAKLLHVDEKIFED